MLKGLFWMKIPGKLLIAGQAQDSFFGRYGHAAWLRDLNADGCIFVKINLSEKSGSFLIRDGTAPVVTTVLPGGAQLPVVMMALLHQIVAAQVAGQPSKHRRIGHPLINDFGQFQRCHEAPPVKASQFSRPVEA
jgi:hypothetical protein